MLRSLLALLLLGSLTQAIACHRTSAGPDPTTRLEECEALDGRAAADDCYERLAIKLAKPALCERIVGPRSKNSCFQRVGLLVSDPALCAKIDESTSRGMCRAELANKLGDPSLCHAIDRVEGQASCLQSVAVAKKDVVLCDTIAIIDVRIDCISKLANGAPEACMRITGSADRDKCLSRALSAVADGRDARCDLIADLAQRDECWLSAARRRRDDETLCAKVSSGERADRCRADVAQTKHDAAPCEQIVADEPKDLCIAEVARLTSDTALCARLHDAARQKTCSEHATSSAGALSAFRKGVTRVSDTEYIVTRASLDQLLANQAELMRNARIVPEQEAGKMVGVRLFGVRPDTLLGVVGFENGDRLERINGFDVTSPEKALEGYARLRTTEKLNVDISRRGAPRRLVYTITK